MKKVSSFFIISLFVTSGILGFLFSLYMHHGPRIIQIETVHAPATFVKQIENDPAAGEKIFHEFCAACHAVQPAIQINAPRIGGPEWQGLKKLGIDRLLSITISGTKAMPARGGCFECSDEQLKETVQYMCSFK